MDICVENSKDQEQLALDSNSKEKRSFISPSLKIKVLHLDFATADSLLFFYFFLDLFLAALGLRCGVRAFSSCVKGGLLFVAVRGLLIVVASLVAELGL